MGRRASAPHDRGARLKQELEEVRAELEAARTTWQQRRGAEEPVVSPRDVARVVAEWTGIPAERLEQGEMERLLKMEDALASRVVGQEDAIRAVSEAVRRARTGLKDPAFTFVPGRRATPSDPRGGPPGPERPEAAAGTPGR